MRVRNDHLGLNGSATYICIFKEVFVPDALILLEDANSFSNKVRLIFIAYQIPLVLGVVEASIDSIIENVTNRQNGCNQFLKTQPDPFAEAKQTFELSDHFNWKDIAKIRYSTAY